MSDEPNAEDAVEPPTIAETFQYDWNGQIAQGLARFARIADQVRREGAPHPTTPRHLLDLFNFKKRGALILEGLRKAATKLGVEIRPFLDAVGFDDEIEVRPVTDEEPAREAQGEPETSGAPDTEGDQKVHGGGDLFKIGRLPSARAGINAVRPEDKLSVAWSRMAFHGHSQLPVMRSSRDVVGTINWSCLGRALSRGAEIAPDGPVKDFMLSPPRVCTATDPLMDVLSRVIEDEFVLVRDERNEISGIITTTDISEFLQGRYRGFSLLEEIERAMRSWLQTDLSVEQIKAARSLDSPMGEVQTVDDLVFSEYRTLFADHWEELGAKLDRGEFLRRLEEINGIRNDLMHFSGDEIEDGDYEALVRFLEGLRFLGRAR